MERTLRKEKESGLTTGQREAIHEGNAFLDRKSAEAKRNGITLQEQLSRDANERHRRAQEDSRDPKITTKGRDFKGPNTDVHVRREGSEIMVDVFDSTIKDADEAHLSSESFPANAQGAKEASEFLKGEGIEEELTV